MDFYVHGNEPAGYTFHCPLMLSSTRNLLLHNIYNTLSLSGLLSAIYCGLYFFYPSVFHIYYLYFSSILSGTAYFPFIPIYIHEHFFLPFNFTVPSYSLFRFSLNILVTAVTYDTPNQEEENISIDEKINSSS